MQCRRLHRQSLGLNDDLPLTRLRATGGFRHDIHPDAVIPVAGVQPVVPSPLPTCTMPPSDEITEEGFGYFRGTWRLDHVPVREAQATVRGEAQIIERLDRAAPSPDEFELLAAAIENQTLDQLPDSLRATVLAGELAGLVTDEEDPPPLDGLEIGVAGLTHALSTIRCRTTASCRSHVTNHSWSDCPVVFFVASAWRVDLLSELVSEAGCGLGTDRDMLTAYGASIRDTHRLAERIIAERGRFTSMPDRWRPARGTPRPRQPQLNLLAEREE